MVTLGLNVDHVATLREARKDIVPNLLKAALDGIQGGAKGITIHLREDRRHIQDQDVFLLKKKISVPLNLEMSVASDVVRVALLAKPEKACLVPEKRKELTTEGGLDVMKNKHQITSVVACLKSKRTLVSLFIDPQARQIRAASEVGANFIELHTGVYARSRGSKRQKELGCLRKASEYAHSLGLRVNAGHGLNYENVMSIAHLPYVEELNIGHAIIARAVFVGIREAVREMVRLIK